MNLWHFLEISKSFNISYPPWWISRLGSLITSVCLPEWSRIARIVWQVKLKERVLCTGYKWHLNQKNGSVQECLWCCYETMGYKETWKLLLRLSGNRKYLTLKSLNIWIFQNVSQHTHLYTSVDWQAVNQTDWQLFLAFTKDVSVCVFTLKAIGQMQLHWELQICCPIWSNFYWKSEINPGGGLSLPWKIRNTNQCVFSSFVVDLLNWQSFMEIGEMACSSSALFSHGLTRKTYGTEPR